MMTCLLWIWTVLNSDSKSRNMDSMKACMRKRNGIYYIVYTDISRGKATCLSYAMSDKPLGPYKKGGVIIDNSTVTHKPEQPRFY